MARVLACTAAWCALKPTPPATRVAPVTDVLHGVPIVDPYRWLEDQSSPETRAWKDAARLPAPPRLLPQGRLLSRRSVLLHPTSRCRAGRRFTAALCDGMKGMGRVWQAAGTPCPTAPAGERHRLRPAQSVRRCGRRRRPAPARPCGHGERRRPGHVRPHRRLGRRSGHRNRFTSGRRIPAPRCTPAWKRKGACSTVFRPAGRGPRLPGVLRPARHLSRAPAAAGLRRTGPSRGQTPSGKSRTAGPCCIPA